MNKLHLKIIGFLIGSFLMTGCQKKVNDWDIDSSHDRLFKSLVFETSKIDATELEIRYTQTISAEKYVFEFSKDSLMFSEIVKTVEILADTLTPFAPSTSPARVEYRTMFGDLDGNSQYSVRMKGVNMTSGTESNYSVLTFKTLSEQLFTGSEIFIDRFILQWRPTDRVTHISVFDAITGEEKQNVVLTEQMKQNGHCEIKDLTSGTNYRVVIYNEDIERGVLTLKTSGLQGGVTIAINPGDDIPALVSQAISQGSPNVTLLFKGGQTYDLGVLTLPAGLSNVSFTGEPDASGIKPQLKLAELKLSDLIFGKVLLENIALMGTNINGYFVNLSTNGVAVEEYAFVDCYMTTYRSAVRLGNNSISVKNILFDDCIIHNMGGYGIVNIAGSTPGVDSISFKNSTLTELSTQMMDVRNKVKQIYIGNCTFYNQNVALTQLLRFDTNNLPLAVTTESNIISGNNSGGKINSLSYNMANTSVNISFGGSYRTNELTINQYDFADISVFNGSAADLFVDPQNRNFSIKPTANFAGRGSAGDPRWMMGN